MNWRVATAAWALVAALLAFCALPALFGGFVYDDTLIEQHPLFDGPSNLWLALSRTSHDYVPDMLDAASGFTYRPLPVMSLIATNILFGRTPLPHHLVSLALHLSTCALIVLLGVDLRTWRVPPLWLFVTLLFALHPAVGETYQWISGRNDLLAGCALATLAVLLRARAQGVAWTRRGAAFFAACALVLTFGALSKEPFLVAAAFLLLAECVPERDAAPRGPRAGLGRIAGLAPALLGWVLSGWVLRVLRGHAASAAPQGRGLVSTVQDPAFLLRVPRALALGVETVLLPSSRPMRALSWELVQAWTVPQVGLLALSVGFALWLVLRKQFRAVILLAGAAATFAPTAAVADYFWLGLDRYLCLPLILLLVALRPAVPALQARIDALPHGRQRGYLALATCIALWFMYANRTNATYFESQVAFARALITARPEDPSGYLVGVASVDNAGRADVVAYLHSLSKRDLPPAFAHAAAIAQSRSGLYREAAETLERAGARFPQNGHVRFDLLELRGTQHRFREALELSDALLRDARLCPVTHAKLREWDGEPSLPGPVRELLRAQLAAHPCG